MYRSIASSLLLENTSFTHSFPRNIIFISSLTFIVILGISFLFKTYEKRRKLNRICFYCHRNNHLTSVKESMENNMVKESENSTSSPFSASKTLKRHKYSHSSSPQKFHNKNFQVKYSTQSSHYKPHLEWFKCLYCDCENFFDDRGEITDPSFDPNVEDSTVQSSVASPRFSILNKHPFTQGKTEVISHRPGETSRNESHFDSSGHISQNNPTRQTSSSTSSSPFCERCILNQNLVKNILSDYLVDEEDDPEFERKIAEYPKMKKELEERYPLVCDSCQHKVDFLMKQNHLKAQSILGTLKTTPSAFFNSELGKTAASSPVNLFNIPIGLKLIFYTSYFLLALVSYLPLIDTLITHLPFQNTKTTNLYLDHYLFAFLIFLHSLFVLSWNVKMRQHAYRMLTHKPTLSVFYRIIMSSISSFLYSMIAFKYQNNDDTTAEHTQTSIFDSTSLTKLVWFSFSVIGLLYSCARGITYMKFLIINLAEKDKPVVASSYSPTRHSRGVKLKSVLHMADENTIKNRSSSLQRDPSSLHSPSLSFSLLTPIKKKKDKYESENAFATESVDFDLDALSLGAKRSTSDSAKIDSTDSNIKGSNQSNSIDNQKTGNSVFSPPSNEKIPWWMLSYSSTTPFKHFGHHPSNLKTSFANPGFGSSAVSPNFSQLSFGSSNKASNGSLSNNQSLPSTPFLQKSSSSIFLSPRISKPNGNKPDWTTYTKGTNKMDVSDDPDPLESLFKDKLEFKEVNPLINSSFKRNKKKDMILQVLIIFQSLCLIMIPVTRLLIQENFANETGLFGFGSGPGNRGPLIAYFVFQILALMIPPKSMIMDTEYQHKMTIIRYCLLLEIVCQLSLLSFMKVSSFSLTTLSSLGTSASFSSEQSNIDTRGKQNEQNVVGMAHSGLLGLDLIITVSGVFFNVQYT